MTKIIVDRIEEDIAICEENDKTVFIPIASLPQDIKEGDILTLSENGYIICKKDTDERRKKLFELQNSLFDQ